MEHVRPSILHRPQRKASNCTAETAEDQYRREQELLAARSRRLRDAEERLLNSLYPSTATQTARQQEVLRMQEQHMAAKEEAMRLEAQLEKALSQKAHSSNRTTRDPLQDGTVLPWTTATLNFSSADEEREVRKQFAARVAAENLTLIAERSAQRQQQLTEQQQHEKQTVTSENEYWNLGAATRRWIAPEHRHLGPPPSPINKASQAAAPPAAVVPPWALHTSIGDAAEDSRAGSGSLSRSNSFGHGSSVLNDGMCRPHTAGGFEHGMPHSQRRHVQYLQPAPLKSRKHPWEWNQRATQPW